jgi:hypothetical protein
MKVYLTAFKEKGLLDAWNKYSKPVVKDAKEKGVEIIVVGLKFQNFKKRWFNFRFES